MKLPNVIQTFFTDDEDHHELCHDYYLNATWVIGLVERFGGQVIGERIRRSIEAKRKACIKKYGSEWERKEEILKK